MGSKAKTPSYDTNASQQNQIWAADQARKYGNVNVNSDLGGYTWTTNPDGTQTINTNLNEGDQQRLNLQTNALNNLNLDPTSAQDAYYSMSTRYLQPQQQQQQQQLESNLASRGIPIGSKAYNNATTELYNNQQNALDQARDNSIFQGQNYLGSQIGNINSIGSQVNNPLQSMVQGTGGQFGGQYDAKFAADAAKAQEDAAYSNDMTQKALQAAAMAAMAFSDIRLKENIFLVGRVSDVNIYMFDYINGEKDQVGVIAQELLDSEYKDAVKECRDGYYMVDYSRLPSEVNDKIKEIHKKLSNLHKLQIQSYYYDSLPTKKLKCLLHS